MAIIVEGRNPDDGISTYDQMEFHRSDTSGGSFTLQTTVSIDLTTRTDLSPGYSQYIDATGSTSKYYKIRWKNSSSLATSSLSDEFQGGTTVLDTRFRRMMRDTNSANYYFSNDDIANFRKDAIFSLWPATWQEAIDTSLTSSSSTEIYTLPSSVTRLNKVQLIDTNGNVVAQPTDYELVSKNIIFSTAPTDGYTMRLFVEKMFIKSAEVPETFDSYLLDFMMLQSYREMEADRMSFYKYNTVIKSDGGNVPSLRAVIERLENSVEKRLNALRRVRRPSEIGMQG